MKISERFSDGAPNTFPILPPIQKFLMKRWKSAVRGVHVGQSDRQS